LLRRDVGFGLAHFFVTTVPLNLTKFRGPAAASEPYGGGAERNIGWLLKAIQDNRTDDGDQDRRDAARNEAGHCRPL